MRQRTVVYVHYAGACSSHRRLPPLPAGGRFWEEKNGGTERGEKGRCVWPRMQRQRVPRPSKPSRSAITVSLSHRAFSHTVRSHVGPTLRRPTTLLGTRAARKPSKQRAWLKLPRARATLRVGTLSRHFTVLQLHTPLVPKRSSVFRFELQRCFQRRGLPGFSISRCERRCG